MSAEDLAAQEALMQFLYQAPIGLVQARRDGAVEMLNPKSAQLLMPLAGSGTLDNLFDVLRTAAPGLRAQVEAFGDPTGVICDGLRLRVDADAAGGPRVVALCLVRLGADRYMASLTDATSDVARETQSIEHRLRDAARMDSLTRLPNRTAALEAVQHSLARQAGGGDEHLLAVLFLDCDRFRRINDSYGHATGDAVLGRIAERLRATLRTGDFVGRSPGMPLAARIAGDEFVVVLDDIVSLEDAVRVAERLLHVLADPHRINAQRVHAPMSIGIAVASPGAADADVLMQDASLAMVEAKREGGGRYVVFDVLLRELAASRGTMEEDLRRALAEGELFVVYQPVVGLQDETGVDHAAGVEALVRWRHPQRGLVGPGDFIPVAEASGLIGPLGAFVLDAACRQHARWRRLLGSAAPRTLAVNLSRAQLEDADIVSTVAATLRRHGTDPRHLQLEVTESLAAQDERVRAQLHDLKALGLSLALDDFGTGYSSLASLQLLPVDTVKIDRTFVHQVDTSGHHRALVEAMVKVARSLGMRTVAEGVETAAQAERVRELGCDKGQGWFFGRPVESDALVDWLARHAAMPVS